MLLVWAWPFSQMPRMRAGLADWASSTSQDVAVDQQAVVDGAAGGVGLHADGWTRRWSPSLTPLPARSIWLFEIVWLVPNE